MKLGNLSLMSTIVTRSGLYISGIQLFYSRNPRCSRGPGSIPGATTFPEK
jgi:hypothetical protein